MNFSGDFKRQRNINMGGRRAAPLHNRTTLLQKAQEDRERREAIRQRESAAIAIQAFYRGRIATALARQRGQIEWLHKYTSGTADLVGESSPQPDLTYAITLFIFSFQPSDADPNLKTALTALSNMLSCGGQLPLAALNRGLCRRLGDHLAKIMRQLIPQQPQTSSNDYIDTIKIILAIYRKIHNLVDSSTQILSSVATLASSLAKWSLDDQSMSNALSSTLVEVAKSNTRGFVEAVLITPRFFLLVDRSALESLQASVWAYLELQALRDPTWLAAHTPQSKLWLFINMLVWSPIETWTKGIFHTLTSLLSLIPFQIRSHHEDKDKTIIIDIETDKALSLDDSLQSNDSGSVYTTSDGYLLTNLYLLCSRSTLNAVFALKPDVDDMAAFFTALSRLLPAQHNDLMLHLSLTALDDDSSPFHLFWYRFMQSDIYELTTRGDFNATNFRDLCTNPELSLQWANMVIALELYSYWLIIADDTEFRSNVTHGLALDGVQAMATFLRNFTFTLLWNLPMTAISSSSTTSTAAASSSKRQAGDASEAAFITLDRLRTGALRVMKQIYIRDSRRAFLPSSFWLMTNKFDMEVFIPAAVEEEERRYELSLIEDDSDDEDNNNNTIRNGRASNTTGSSGPVAAVTSRLNILQQAPFFIPFNTRVSIFQAFIALDQARRANVNINTNTFDFLTGTSSRHKADVRREFLLQDAYEGFNQLGPDLKSAIGVTFYNEYGPEAGIDGGGITKEFLTSVCKEAFNPSHPLKLFASTTSHLLYPNPALGTPIPRSGGVNNNNVQERITLRRQQLSYMEFLGRIIGKCLYEGILVDVEFAPFFLQKWGNLRNTATTTSNSNIKSSFDDLYWLDPELYNGLIKVHKYPGNVEHDLGLNFTTMHIDDRGQPISIDLKRGGGGHSVAVTNSNRLEYIHAVANFKLNTVLQAQTNAFITGINDIIAPNWLSMFNAPELQMLVSGGSAGIDIADLRRHTIYGGYLETDQTVEYFWQVLEEFTDAERRKLIKFVTSVARAPLLGFEVLRPLFAIRNAGADKDRLPTASTCVNLLKLPDYKSKPLLRQKLLYAINAEAGFDLS